MNDLAIETPPLRQRADYTHSYNSNTGRHGWLRLTPAYSVKIVEEMLAKHSRPLRVLDPFCGTGTTALSAAYRGYTATTIDINPFLVWLGRAKTASYSANVIERVTQICSSLVDIVGSERAESIVSPPISNIERWWPPNVIDYLCALKGAIDVACEGTSSERMLLEIAFCRTLIASSNAAFNHQSMSFKDCQESLFALNRTALDGMFRQDVKFVLKGAMDNPKGDAAVISGDARNLGALDAEFDLVVTSPPYANRMSYIRELRPYMYWLGYLKSAREAGELDWEAIGGTWGVATSRLMARKESDLQFKDERLDKFLAKVAHPKNKNGTLLANYVAKYFDDIWLHLSSLTEVLKAGCELHYIVGNSTFYGVLLPVEDLYAEMLRRLQFADVKCRAIRKRNSKKELFEFDVSARWPDG
ncbi:MAG: DNA adenine methylase [Gammaproteobacteria bacterium]|nr:DNA adenine methylase [Gammaproteobacteria bacterium]